MIIISILQLREPQLRGILNTVAKTHWSEMAELGCKPDSCILGQALNLCVLMHLCPEDNMLKKENINPKETLLKEYRNHRAEGRTYEIEAESESKKTAWHGETEGVGDA